MKTKAILISLALAVVGIANAQIAGKTTTIRNAGVKATVAQLMSRDKAFGPLQKQHARKSYEIEHEFEFENLPQNPASPASATWPPNLTDVPTPGKPIENIGPRFSVPVNFGGPQSSESPYVPPDSNGDASLSSVIVAANGRIRSYSRTGTAGSMNMSFDTFFSSLTATGVSDPRVVFDRITNRWFVAGIDLLNSNNNICLAVSNGEAITGSTVWTFFKFAQNIGGGQSGFADYETLGVDANGVYLGSNRFNDDNTFNTDLFAINKSQLLSGSLNVTVFRNLISGGTGMFTPWPATNDDPTATVAYVIAADAGFYGRLDYRRVTYSAGTFSISANNVLTTPSTYAPIAMTIPLTSGTTTIDSLDHRLFYARVFKNRLTGAVTVHTAQNIRTNSSGVGGSTGDRTAVRWYNIGNVFSGTSVLTASGTVLDAGASPKFCTIPSTAMNGQGHQFIGFTMGNSTTRPGVGGSYRLSTDGLVTAPTMITAGTGDYNPSFDGTPHRWGDYSFTIVDPRDMMSIWSFQERSNGNNSWQVQAIKVLGPGPTITSFSPSSVTQGQTTNVVITGTGIFDPDSTYPDHLAVSFGSNITVNSITWNSDTQATVNITVGGTAATGARTVTLTNPDGQSTTGSITVNTATKTVTGTLNLTSYTGSVSALQFVYELRDASTNALIETQTLTGLGSGNTFSFTTTQAAGSYKLRIKGVNRFLAKSQAITLTTTGATGLAYTLGNGDCDGSNIVGTPDFNILRAAWGATTSDSNWNVAADLNGDGIIGTADFNIMRSNWGALGDD